MIVLKEDNKLLIELETEDEKALIWHKLNAATGIPFVAYQEHNNLPDMRPINNKVFTELDAVYTPEDF